MNHILKNKIKLYFNKARNTYDTHCSLQKTVCEKAVEILKRYRNQYENAADFACGTAVSTQCLSERVGYSTLYGIDFAEQLLAVAKEKEFREPVEWINADFDDRVFEKDYLDLVFCNMGLQWSLNLKKTLALFYDYLHCSGICALTIPLEGTFPEIHEGHKNSFHSKKIVENALQACGFTLLNSLEEYLVEHFNTQYEALNSIKSIGANCLMSNRTHRSKKGATSAIFVNEAKRTLSYRMGIFIAIKNREES